MTIFSPEISAQLVVSPSVLHSALLNLNKAFNFDTVANICLWEVAEDRII